MGIPSPILIVTRFRHNANINHIKLTMFVCRETCRGSGLFASFKLIMFVCEQTCASRGSCPTASLSSSSCKQRRAGYRYSFGTFSAKCHRRTWERWKPCRQTGSSSKRYVCREKRAVKQEHLWKSFLQGAWGQFCHFALLILGEL